MVERVTERTDGVTAERVTETGGSTVVVERGGGGTGLIIGLVLLIAVVIGAVYLFNQNNRENAKTDAVTQAAKDVGGAAKDVGDAAQDAAKKVQ
ncbi:hypothetical protein [Sphingomonas kyeonggiensis]|jgi:hypothetical protein|uniref:Uncharacterized protein n=1 Tax=Sphingomonas kyeonggiensis TaxID=1268553 RepID=A0A7W6JPK5_9SPHN|nr:hypothetical protein [Sphingomonas kyeonggiensis]MBB4097212.1 hypothetical protein [Sphingomonas kyeonggiensis]